MLDLVVSVTIPHFEWNIVTVVYDCAGPHPTENRVSSPVIGFSPFNVGFLQRFLISNMPRAASVKSAFSTSAPSKLRKRLEQWKSVSAKSASGKCKNKTKIRNREERIVSAETYLVAVNTVFLKRTPLRELPWNEARSTIAFEKSAPSKLESEREKKCQSISFE